MKSLNAAFCWQALFLGIGVVDLTKSEGVKTEVAAGVSPPTGGDTSADDDSSPARTINGTSSSTSARIPAGTPVLVNEPSTASLFWCSLSSDQSPPPQYRDLPSNYSGILGFPAELLILFTAAYLVLMDVWLEKKGHNFAWSFTIESQPSQLVMGSLPSIMPMRLCSS